MSENKSVFETLNAINVNEHTEKKGNLTYLSWAWAWGKVKTSFPLATYTIYEQIDMNGYTINYFTDGRTCYVKTGVTIEGIEHIEYLPIMDFKNKSIPLENVTSTDINKAIQRSLTKACARHGLGLYIYAGEDLPEEEKQKTTCPTKELNTIKGYPKGWVDSALRKYGVTAPEFFSKEQAIEVVNTFRAKKEEMESQGK